MTNHRSSLPHEHFYDQHTPSATPSSSSSLYGPDDTASRPPPMMATPLTTPYVDHASQLRADDDNNDDPDSRALPPPPPLPPPPRPAASQPATSFLHADPGDLPAYMVDDTSNTIPQQHPHPQTPNATDFYLFQATSSPKQPVTDMFPDLEPLL
ncbi:hypothetical protein BC940DRAFT_311654 [Gongronella butleri]|nr:hypothetical protein BC940DRAFT_311654 [Gongronella butleri]